MINSNFNILTKQLLTICLLLLFCIALSAQSISVSSFRLIESDQSANINGTMVHDQNGEVAALIKVKTAEKDFSFDTGQIGIVKTKQNNGEIWIYVPRGTKKITISHPDYGLLRDYYLNIPIQSGKTYELVLQTNSANGEVEVICSPATADIYIDGEKVGETPQLISNLSVGEHQYRLVCKGYEEKCGSFTIIKNQTAQISDTLSRSRLTINIGKVSFDMIPVDGGTFDMGATSKKNSKDIIDERKANLVTLNSYYIGETEVTQELWQAVMGNNPSNTKGAKKPVQYVSYNDCMIFVNKLKQLTGYDFRLPTEAEWEFAARGGNKSHGYRFSGSDVCNDVAWYMDVDAEPDAVGNSNIHNVKEKRANELGIYDMSGNVEEWCNAWEDSSRVTRGGDYILPSSSCRVTSRRIFNPDMRIYEIGLRLAL